MSAQGTNTSHTCFTRFDFLDNRVFLKQNKSVQSLDSFCEAYEAFVELDACDATSYIDSSVNSTVDSITNSTDNSTASNVSTP